MNESWMDCLTISPSLHKICVLFIYAKKYMLESAKMVRAGYETLNKLKPLIERNCQQQLKLYSLFFCGDQRL